MEILKIIGIIEIRQGKKVIVRSKNKIVDKGLKLLAAFITREESLGSSEVPLFNWTILTGRDKTTTTGFLMTDLVDKIDIQPDTKTYSATRYNTGYDALYTGNWVAGKITEEIGEVALYLLSFAEPLPEKVMFSRLSVADGDFTAFTPDPTKPLTINYTIRFMF